MTAPAPLSEPLGFYPTPLHPLDRLSEALGGGARVWIKRDDQTGLATGGNKVRKLEFLLAEALRSGATAVVTSGGRQSNHCRQTAAAAARLGLRCVLVLDPAARDDVDFRQSGNVLLDMLFGAEIEEAAADRPASDAVARVEDRLKDDGEQPFVIPVGGSNALGALGYAACADEVLDVGPTFARLFVAAGSGGTQAGLLAGIRRRRAHLPVVGIGVGVSASAEEQRTVVHRLAAATAALLGDGDDSVPFDDVLVDGRQVGDGYGRPTAAMLEAVQLVARTEGILLDPVYTGKAMAGLLAAVRGAEATGDVLFVHTGGQAGLFAYREAFERAGRG